MYGVHFVLIDDMNWFGFPFVICIAIYYAENERLIRLTANLFLIFSFAFILMYLHAQMLVGVSKQRGCDDVFLFSPDT